MLQTIDITKARQHFADIINRVRYSGEEFIIQKQGRPAALITQIQRAPAKKSKKISGVEFLFRLSQYKLKGGPTDFAQKLDTYVWE